MAKEKQMRFFHIADLHFGKMLHNVPMIEHDQPAWVEAFLDAVDRYQPDAVVMSGDIYDRRIPSPEAMKLFGHLLSELAIRDKYVFIIPGNHDSDIRLSHMNDLLSSRRIFIAGELEKQLLHVTVPGKESGPDVTFWLLPFLFPRLVSDPSVLDDPNITSYDAAARAMLAAQEVNFTGCNVLLAHQNVLANGNAPEHSGSESIIGGLGEIDVSAFDGFDYVALGHIHNMQAIGRETVRYAGCPLYYDFSELGRKKDLTLVTVNSKEDITVESVEIPLLHNLKQVSGTLEELLNKGKEIPDKERFYIQAILRDPHVPPRAMEQLQAVYGNSLINVKRDLSVVDSGLDSLNAGDKSAGENLSIEKQFGRFYHETQGELLDGAQEAVLYKILEQQMRRDESYVKEAKYVPPDDTEELIQFLLDMERGNDNETA